MKKKYQYSVTICFNLIQSTSNRLGPNKYCYYLGAGVVGWNYRQPWRWSAKSVSTQTQK
jgi:hypothetical protein